MDFRLSKKAKQRRLTQAVLSGVLVGGFALGSSGNVAFAAETTAADTVNTTVVRQTMDAMHTNTASAMQRMAVGTTRSLARGTANALAVNQAAMRSNAVLAASNAAGPTWKNGTSPLDLRKDMTNYSVIQSDGKTDGAYIIAGSNSNLNNTKFLTSGSSDGGEMGIMVLGPSDTIDMSDKDKAMASIKDSTGIADFTNSTFVNDAGDIAFLTGTAITKASAFKGNTASKGGIYIGAPDVSPYTAIQAHAVVKLIGNETFDTTAKNYIHLNSKGPLEASSAQIFQKGLGNGAVLNPEAVRTDVNDAIYFQGGTVLLDDPVYNANYLTQANILIKEADGGSTNVEINSGASIVTPTVAIGDLTNDSYFAPVNADKTGIVIGASGDSKVDIFNAQSLNLSAAGAGVANTVTVDGKKLHLGSSTSGQQLITAGNYTPTVPVELVVKNSGSLVLGTGNVANTLTAAVTLGTDGSTTDATTMTVSNGVQTVTSIVANKGTSLNVDAGATLQATDAITLKSGSKMNLNGTLTGTRLSGTDAVIHIGDSTHAGILSLPSGSSLTGSMVFLDPVWSGSDEITDASKLADSSTTLDYSLTVGQNSVASLGTADNSEAETYFSQSAQSWGEKGMTAALYLAQPVVLDATHGGIKVDGALTSTNVTGNYATANTATFGANSLLMVNGSNLNGSPALTSTGGALSVDSTAKLYLANTANAAVGTTYQIVSGFTDTTAAKGWYTSADNIIMNKLLTKSVSAGAVTITGKRSLAEALPNAVLRNTVDNMTLDAASSNAGVKYLSTLLIGNYTDEEATLGINTAALAAETVGATSSAVSAVRDFADTAQQHFSFIDDTDGTHGQNVWVKYTHDKSKASGAVLSGMTVDYNGNYNSLMVGHDFVTKGKLSSGVAFMYGSGNTGGDAEHDGYSAWGGSYYGSLRNGKSNLLFDAGYAEVSHDVTGTIAASPKNKIFTAGVAQEYKYQQGNTQIIPHVGLRYLNINTPAYDGSWGGQTAFHYAPQNKNLFVLPIGVGFNTDHARQDGWHFKLNGDLSYLGILGDVSGSMDVSVPGLNGMDLVNYDLMDRHSFLGRLGMEFSRDNVAVDLGYSYQKGSTHEANRFMVSCNIAF